MEQIFIGCKAVSSDFIETDMKGTLGKVATGIEILGKLAKLIPAMGNTFDALIENVSNTMKFIDKERQTNILKSISNLGTLEKIQKMVEKFARDLTEKYTYQIKALAKNQDDSLKNLLNKNIQHKILKNNMDSPPEELANFAVIQILCALLERKITADKALDVQFMAVISNPKTEKIEQLKQAVMKSLGLTILKTHENKSWKLSDIFIKPGIQTAEGHYYSGKGTEPEMYGYCRGSKEEAEERSLQLVLTNPEKSESEKNNAIKISTNRKIEKNNSHQIANNESHKMYSPPTTYQQTQEDKIKFLEEQLKAAEIKRSENDRIINQMQKNIEKLMVMLGEQQEENDIDNESQNMMQIKAKNSAFSTNGLSKVSFLREQANIEQRLQSIEQHIAIESGEKKATLPHSYLEDRDKLLDLNNQSDTWCLLI